MLASWLDSSVALRRHYNATTIAGRLELAQAAGDVGTGPVDQGAVVALDHRDACAHDPRQLEHRHPGHKPRGWRIDAPDRSSNVDGVVALMMALDRLENQSEPVKLLGWL